jgi:hypothetical protein
VDRTAGQNIRQNTVEISFELQSTWKDIFIGRLLVCSWNRRVVILERKKKKIILLLIVKLKFHICNPYLLPLSLCACVRACVKFLKRMPINALCVLCCKFPSIAVERLPLWKSEKPHNFASNLKHAVSSKVRLIYQFLHSPVHWLFPISCFIHVSPLLL